MRGRTAKRLRREAQEKTVGKEESVYSHNSYGNTILGDCTRKAYKELKKEWKQK